MTYEEALAELEKWGLPSVEVLETAMKALKDCLEMGLTGEGE